MINKEKVDKSDKAYLLYSYIRIMRYISTYTYHMYFIYAFTDGKLRP